jgi:hypothetical protein
VSTFDSLGKLEFGSFGRTKGLSGEENLVLSHIKSSGNEGTSHQKKFRIQE